jgi:hypothetical protein
VHAEYWNRASGAVVVHLRGRVKQPATANPKDIHRKWNSRHATSNLGRESPAGHA